MFKSLFIFILKTLIITFLILLIYYLLILKPKIEAEKKLNQAEETLRLHKDTLVQNRISFVEITRLNPKYLDFQRETSIQFNLIEKTQKEGLKLIEEKNYLPPLNLDLNFQELLDETKTFYDQETFLKKVRSTTSYKEGLEILKSDEAINLLVRQTNLILKYNYWLEKVKNFKRSHSPSSNLSSSTTPKPAVSNS